MAVEEALEDTWEEFKLHPWLIGGALVALIAIIWLMRRGNSSSPQAFTFSYGPSDAQVLAGTQLQIAQAADQTALNIANLNSTQQGTATNDYFQYLTQNSANSLAAVKANDQTAQTQSFFNAAVASQNNSEINANENAGIQEAAILGNTALNLGQQGAATSLAATLSQYASGVR